MAGPQGRAIETEGRKVEARPPPQGEIGEAGAAHRTEAEAMAGETGRDDEPLDEIGRAHV